MVVIKIVVIIKTCARFRANAHKIIIHIFISDFYLHIECAGRSETSQ